MPNLDAFLTTIAISEGTAGVGDDGYNVLVGSTPENPHLFTSYADHPRQYIDLGHGLVSTAAGRYQILERFYDAYKAKLDLPDFSPASQDAIAIQMIRERGALDLIQAGRFNEAIARVNNLWASLPGNDYDQHSNHIADLRIAFVTAGGTISEA